MNEEDSMELINISYENRDQDYEDLEYLDYLIGNAHFELDNGSKAMTKFKVRKNNLSNSKDYWSKIKIVYPKMPFFAHGKKRRWHTRVHLKLKVNTAERIREDWFWGK